MPTTTARAAGPSLYRVKRHFVAALEPVQRWLARHGVAPNTVSLAAVPVIFAASGAIVAGTRAPGIWLLVPPLCLMWMAINAVDGALARSTRRASLRGAALNEAIDRLGDVVIIAASIAVAPLWLVAITGAAVLSAEMVSLIAWAVCGDRTLVGPMGKPDRALVVATAAIGAVLWPAAWTVGFALIAAGAAVAVFVRFRHLLAATAGVPS